MKGFTLIELLAVLALLAVVALIAITSGMSILNDSKNSLSDRQKDTIVDAAKNYQAAGEIDEGFVTIEKLSDSGYLDSEDLIDPKDKTDLTGGVCIKHSVKTDESGNIEENKYSFEYLESETDCN